MDSTAPITHRKYTAQEERVWNQLTVMMSHFHEHFKREFNSIYEMADGSFTKIGYSLPLFLRQAQQLNSHLTMHHTIEEREIFPILAKRMPDFDHNTEGVHLKSHEGIHDGLEELEKLVKNYRANPSSYSPTEMRACLDGFRQVLFEHLDQEVADLKGENLKKYWTFEEMQAIVSRGF